MKKKDISIIIFNIFMLSLCVNFFPFKKNDYINVYASQDEIFLEKPNDLNDLQNATDEQLDIWSSLSSFDGRDYDYITPARNQGSKLICWVYAAVGAVEANILRNGIDPSLNKNNLNLDENVAAYSRFNRDGLNDPLLLTTNDTFSGTWNQGSHAEDAFSVMTQGYSLVNQTTNDYSNDNQIKNAIAESKYFIKGYHNIPNNKEEIKKAILKYGSVTMEYKAPNNWQRYLYYSDGTATNHASLIVGWDDTISKNNFLPNKPQNDGAWIVKNSWGSHGFSKNSTYCFYLSYDSYFAGNFSVVETALKKDYPNLYYYDGQIAEHTNRYVTDAHGVIYEAKLSSKTKQEQLKAVTFGIRNQDLIADIKIYRHLNANPCNINDKNNIPNQGELVAHKENLYFKYDGTYTIDLDEPINLDQGEYFSIVISGVDKNNNCLYLTYGSDTSQSTNDMTYRLYNNVWTNCGYGQNFIDGTHMTCRIRAITSTILRKNVLENDLQYARVEIEKRQLDYANGQSLFPNVTVYFDDKILQEEQDYYIVANNNTKPGYASITINGMNDYYGTREVLYEILPLKYPPNYINNGIIEVYNDVVNLYDITLPTNWVWDQTDFKLNNGLSDFGYTIRYVGEDKEYYQITSRSVKINKLNQDPPTKIDINKTTVEIIGDYFYIGEKIIPTIKVSYSGKELYQNMDYTIEYTNNLYAGQATLTLKGKGYYTGAKNQMFIIKKANHPKQTPNRTITIHQNNIALNDIDLDCKDWAWVNPNQKIYDEKTIATIQYIGEDKENYEFLEIQITIILEKLKDISNISSLNLEQTSYVYTGNDICPKVIALDNDITLKENIDYEISYQNNINAGIGKVIINGINNYNGTKELEFTIKKANRNQFKVTQENWTYNDENKPNPKVEGKEEESEIIYLYSNKKDGEYKKERPTDAGTYWIKSIILESTNYNEAEDITQFIILPKNIENLEITIESKDFVYNGQAIEPSFIILDNDITLKENIDYIFVYENNINATNNAIIKIQGQGNYCNILIKTFEIKKAPLKNISTTIHVEKQVDNLKDITLPEGFIWDENSITRVAKNVIKATAIYVGENYNVESIEFEIIIDDYNKQNNLTWIWISLSSSLVIISVIISLIIVYKKKKFKL